MRILITGICGFAGSILAHELPGHLENLQIVGVDNLSRPGSERNRKFLRERQITVAHGDIRNSSDLEGLPQVDWVIDAAANPSVLAGITAGTTSRQLMEHNLLGTINVLEFCKRQKSGLVLLSTSRVYSAARLCALPLETAGARFIPNIKDGAEPGLSKSGVGEAFSTAPPLSLYGAAKLASEIAGLEYAAAFDFPLHINRCGVLAGAGQFGKPDQGIFSFWVHAYHARRPLKYIGFGGKGYQVRDCLHPRDLARLVAKQIRHPERGGTAINVAGGLCNSISLAELSQWCANRFGAHAIPADPQDRPYDVPWLVLDSAKAQSEWDWQPEITLEQTLSEIAEHAEQNPQWLELSDGA